MTTVRAEQQRARILDAAQACFVRDGFHAASMASIAEAAGMSAGLIYRYFDSKNSIILAIIERQLQEKLAGIASLADDPDVRRRFLEFVTRLRRGDAGAVSPALLLELAAQATRDPQIAAAVARSDRAGAAALRRWMAASDRARGLAADDAGVRARTLALQCLFEGLAMRVAKDPELELVQVGRVLDLLLPPIIAGAGRTPVRREA